MLQAYNYTLKHKSGQENGHADDLSRLPLPKYEIKPENRGIKPYTSRGPYARGMYMA